MKLAMLEPEGKILHSVQNHIVPFLTENYSMADEGLRRHSGFESSFNKDHREIYRLIKFENPLIVKVTDFHDLINSYEAMIVYSEELLELISQQIEK